MNSEEIIDCYVADVVRRLPRRQRADVGVELGSLLTEEFADRRADRPDQAEDQAALELVRGFGRPAEVATRYRPPLVLIDPADSRAVLRAAVIGVALLWILGAVAVWQLDLEPLTAVGQWWTTVALPAFAWPGFLLAASAVGAWVRRRWPDRSVWKPRPAPERRFEVNRIGYVAAMLAAIIGVTVLIRPQWLLAILFGGSVPAPAAEAFAYDQSFVDTRAPWLLGLGAVQLILYVTIVVRGRWSAATRRVDAALTLVIVAVLTWVALAGNVFQAKPTDDSMRGAMLLTVAFVIIGLVARLWRLRQRRSLHRGPSVVVGTPDNGALA